MCGDDFYVEAGFFFYFSEDGLDWVFVRFDVSAGGKPGLDAVVPVKKGGIAVYYEAGGGEVAVEECFGHGISGWFGMGEPTLIPPLFPVSGYGAGFGHFPVNGETPPVSHGYTPLASLRLLAPLSQSERGFIRV